MGDYLHTTAHLPPPSAAIAPRLYLYRLMSPPKAVVPLRPLFLTTKWIFLLFWNSTCIHQRVLQPIVPHNVQNVSLKSPERFH